MGFAERDEYVENDARLRAATWPPVEVFGS